jgi:hypothetical protein
LQPDPDGALASAAERADVYWAMTLLLMAAVVHPLQAAAGQEGTWPTATQSSSTMQDWS